MEVGELTINGGGGGGGGGGRRGGGGGGGGGGDKKNKNFADIFKMHRSSKTYI